MITLPMIAAAAVLTAGGALYRGRSVRYQIIRAAKRVVPYKREHATNKIVSQGRAFAPKYSGCGDLWNYVLDVVGAPDNWVNRDSARRGSKWKAAVNLSKPWGAALNFGAVIKFKKGGPWPKAGDLLLIGREPQELAHAIVITKKLGPRRYQTAEYGAASNAGVIGERVFDETGLCTSDKFKRHIVGWIDAGKIPVDKKYAPGAVRSLMRLSIPERKAAA